MAIKKEIFENYIKQRESFVLNKAINNKTKYSHHKIFAPYPPPIEGIDITQSKSGHKADTDRTQTGHRPDTKRIQTGHKPDTENVLSKHKVDTELNTIANTNRTQSEHKLNTRNSFSTLVGIQRKIMLFLYENCKTTRNKETESLTLEHLANQLDIRAGSVKTTLRRLQTKNFIKRITFKNGRGGWSKYEVPGNLYSEIMQLETEHKLNTNRAQTEHKTDTELGTKLNTSVPSSSGNYIYKETTTGDTQYQLPTEWRNLDIEQLNNIGFTKNHLVQIALQNKLSVQTVQDSIYAFAFDLQENNKAKSIKGDPINFFMGILRNGRVYTFPSNYESPQDKAMRLYTEQRRVVEQKKKLLEKESFDLAFGEWFGELTEAQKIAFLPENMQNTKIAFGKNKVIESAARSYFEKEIWPDKKQEIIKTSGSLGQELQQQISADIEQEVSNVENN